MEADIRKVLRENVLRLMESKGVANPYALSRYLKGRGVPVSQRTVAYTLDPDEARHANLSTVASIAAGFGLQAWQLLVPGLDPAHPPQLQPAPDDDIRLSRASPARARTAAGHLLVGTDE